MFRTSFVLMVALSLIAGLAGAQEKVTLASKFPPGVYTTTMNQQMNVQMAMPGGQQMDQKQTMMMVSQITAGPVEPTGQKIEMAFKRIKQSMQMGPMNMGYDSADPNQSSSPLAPIFKALLDAKISFTMTADGNVKDVTGLDSMIDDMVKQNPALASMAKTMKSQMGDNMVRQMIGAGNQMLPNKPVGPGDTWTTKATQNLGMLGDMTISNDCKLAALQKTPKGRIAVIEFKGKATTAEGKAAPMPGAKLDKLDMDMTGTSRFNADTGMLVQNTTNIKAKMSMTIGGSDDQPGMGIDMVMEGKVDQSTTEGKYEAPAAEKKAAPKSGGEVF